MPSAFSASLLLAAQVWLRLPPPLRARVLLALLGLVILGIAMVVLVMLGGRYVRRMSRAPAEPTKISRDEWYRKPLAPPLESRDHAEEDD